MMFGKEYYSARRALARCPAHQGRGSITEVVQQQQLEDSPKDLSEIEHLFRSSGTTKFRDFTVVSRTLKH
jgi:hypothetical protein